MLGLAVLSLRYAARSLALSRTLLYHQYQPTHLRDALRNRESFSTTPRLLASELPDDFINVIKDTELFKRLADKPKALKALSDLYELTKEMGATLFAPCFASCVNPRTSPLTVLTSIPKLRSQNFGCSDS